jgi:hypothetical protein
MRSVGTSAMLTCRAARGVFFIVEADRAQLVDAPLPPVAPRSGPAAVSPAVVQVEGVTMANDVAHTKG